VTKRKTFGNGRQASPADAGKAAARTALERGEREREAPRRGATGSHLPAPLLSPLPSAGCHGGLEGGAGRCL